MQTVTTPTDGVGHTAPIDRAHLDLALLAGLAGVFLVNALVAVLQPDDFVDLVRSSALSDLMPFRPGRWLAWAICVNDLVLGVALVVSMRSQRWRPAVLAWSGLWFLAVTAIKLTSLDAFSG